MSAVCHLDHIRADNRRQTNNAVPIGVGLFLGCQIVQAGLFLLDDVDAEDGREIGLDLLHTEVVGTVDPHWVDPHEDARHRLRLWTSDSSYDADYHHYHSDQEYSSQCYQDDYQ